jgi:hypothetical protein
VDAGFNPPVSVTPNLAQLESDFPFLASPVYGTARDLGPYELFQEGDEPSAIQQIAAPEHKGDMEIVHGK